MSAPKLLDLFCGAGGAGMGYHRAGFEVVGVDIAPHDDYPFEFIQADATALRRDLNGECWHEAPELSALPGRLGRCLGHFDAVHLSPPCPRYCVATPSSTRDSHPDLIAPMREWAKESGLPYVIENVPGAPLDNPVRLCGSSFGLGVRRHRLFESNMALLGLECDHLSQPAVWGVYGDHGDAQPVTRPDGSSRGNKARDAAHAREVLGIDWMTEWDDLADAIPPAYTEFLGTQLIEQIERTAA